MRDELRIGDSPVRRPASSPRCELVQRKGETFFRISDYDAMPAFFLSVVSGFDHWMFVSSTGGLTCGRRDPDNALFPYITDDQVHDAATTTGPVTAMIVQREDQRRLWQPFATGSRPYRLQRNLYKNRLGNRLVFEEINHDLGLTFSYEWTSGERFGFLRHVTLCNHGDCELQIELLDGLRNLLPYGVSRALQSERSTLIDAYKQAEAVEGLPAALITLSSIPSDRAEPSEALKATIVWCHGFDQPKILLSEQQIDDFCADGGVSPERFTRGQRGAFLLNTGFHLDAGQERAWWLVADVDQGPEQVERLLLELSTDVPETALIHDRQAGSDRLRRLLGDADGFQCSADPRVTGRHLSNTLFNVMRGGVFTDGYELPVADFLDFVRSWHAPLHASVVDALGASDGTIRLDSLLDLARRSGDPHLERLAREYLPLVFSRRHGDPSRPWNHFSIRVRNDDGTPCLSFQGNWRDIFQNWEALAYSFPEFAESFIAKFVNASTADGYNPYRIERGGFDWEILDPDDPWSNIGYWGDHQVVYLQRLLHFSMKAHPGRLARWLDHPIFVYADVPYRLCSYEEQLARPRNTIWYDDDRAARIARRVEALGADGRLVTGPDGEPVRVNLMEKLLVPALAKLASLVPGGGIWMNTQRPEWNDANNALVGYGLSMVTLCQLRAYLMTLSTLYAEAERDEFPVTSETAEAFHGIVNVLEVHRGLLDETPDGAQRKAFLDAAGSVADRWRGAVYAGRFDRRTRLKRAEIADAIALALRFLDQSIALNRRGDGLYHTYNLAVFESDRIGIERLPEMLEGQVAVLACGALDARQNLDLLDALRNSTLYRDDQQSYLLYPDRPVPSFRDKNCVPRRLFEQDSWIVEEAQSERPYLIQDARGQVRFGNYRDVATLRAALVQDPAMPAETADRLCELYEKVFRHRHFTGRSGSMYKYEGLGCIYWHMVSKLALAVAEQAMEADPETVEESVRAELLTRFHVIRDGLGVHKSPADYGAFPTDPYSHTPAFAGAQQPGMTGQVKEDVIARLLELGVMIEGGRVAFRPRMLRRQEFLTEPVTWRMWGLGGMQELALEPGCLGFSLCGVPVVYRLQADASVTVMDARGRGEAVEGDQLSTEHSQSLFRREGRIGRIVVGVPEAGSAPWAQDP